MLRKAVAILHRDHTWWRKLLVGGALWLTIVGYPFVEGYQVESIDNTRSGFPTPLPRWNDLWTKVVQGIFAFVIDFFYFVFPILLGGLIFFVGALVLALFDAGTGLLRIVNRIGSILLFVWLGFIWLSSVSPVAKQLYVGEGIPQQALSSTVLRRVLEPPARWVYFKARLYTLPPYLLALGLLGAAWRSTDWSSWLALLLLWLGLTALLYARLITIQVYDMATREVERLRFEARRTRTRAQV
jgi:hypothetical protein